MISSSTNTARADALCSDDGFRVLVVDDSSIIRGFITRWLKEDDEINVVGTASNGDMAIKTVQRCRAEVVLLDIEMPEMDGITALPQILKVSPGIKVIMVSTLTRRNAEISLKATSLGAADYITKPENNRELSATGDFRRELLGKVKVYGAAYRSKSKEPLPSASDKSAGATSTSAASVKKSSTPIELRRPSLTCPRILAIGSSTGGPQALFKVLGGLKNNLRIPVVIAQHMPSTFTAILSEHLAKITGLTCREAEDGIVARAGEVYVAPGGYHVTVESHKDGALLHTNQDPPENFCRPAVDPLFRSVAKAFGPSALCLVLTGMGSDGLGGGQEVVQAGGTLIAQDEQSSVVWGMPGAVATAGICSGVVPIDQIASSLGRLMAGGTP